MRSLLILLTVLHCITCPCPPGFELVRNGECRGLYAIMYEFLDASVDEIVAKCAEVEGKPVIIHNEEHETYWKQRVGSNYFFLGLECNRSAKPMPTWQWTDKTPVDYKPRDEGKLESCDDTSTRGCLWYMDKEGDWSCEQKHIMFTFDIYCTTQLQQPTSPEFGCNSFEEDNEDGICYKVDANVESFKDAQKLCGEYGANLASVHNLQENSFIRRLAVSDGAVNGVFLGATKPGKEDQFGWSDGTSWDYCNFYPGFPVDGRGDCLAMDTLSTSGQWMNINCSAPLAAACSRQENPKPVCTPGPWVEGQTIFSPGYPYDASVPCDYFLTVAEGKRVEVEILLLEANTCCDRMILTDDVLGGKIVANLTGEISDKTYTTSTSNLMRVSWQPNGGVNVRGMMQQSYWASVAGRSSTKSNYVVLGLVCNSTTKKWTWSDGSLVDYKPPSYTSLLTKDCVDGYTIVMQSNAYWNYGNGHTQNSMDIFCTKQLKQVDPDANEGCINFADDSDDGTCYQVGENAETWQDAQLNCKKLGANLASLHNQQENAFLRRLAVSNGAVNGVFLGAIFSGKGDNMGWIDGSAWDYKNFSPGFPKAGFGECLAMDTFSIAGQWMNIDCAAKLPVACIRNEISFVAPNEACSLDTWKEGQIITSPGFPFSASMPCDFFLTVDAGKKVEAEIILLEANSCCDNLLIFDGYLGGSLLANVTGQVSNVTYTTTSSNIMRVVWEPNGGVNVLGLVMTFRGV